MHSVLKLEISNVVNILVCAEWCATLFVTSTREVYHCKCAEWCAPLFVTSTREVYHCKCAEWYAPSLRYLYQRSAPLKMC